MSAFDEHDYWEAVFKKNRIKRWVDTCKNQKAMLSYVESNPGTSKSYIMWDSISSNRKYYATID